MIEKLKKLHQAYETQLLEAAEELAHKWLAGECDKECRTLIEKYKERGWTYLFQLEEEGEKLDEKELLGFEAEAIAEMMEFLTDQILPSNRRWRDLRIFLENDINKLYNLLFMVAKDHPPSRQQVEEWEREFEKIKEKMTLEGLAAVIYKQLDNLETALQKILNHKK